MLRAMGFSSAVVRTAFLFEATFIAVQGVVVGSVLGLVVSYTLLSYSGAFGDEKLAFSVPWVGLTVLLVATLGASLVAVLAPASQAARIKPAVALRIAD
jgi:putative ABC transport system permease protein